MCVHRCAYAREIWFWGLMFKTLGEVIRGERTLTETYWLWFVLPQIPIFLTLLIVGVFSLSIIGYSPRLFYAVTYGAMIFGFVILLLSGFAIYQSAFKNSKTRFGAAVAMIIVAGNIIYGGVRVPGLLLGTVQPAAYEIEQQMTMLNAQLPKRIDAVTSLDRVDMAGSVVTYSFSLDASVAGRIEGSALRALVRPQICRIYATAFGQKRISKVVYSYVSGAEKQFEFEIVPSDCG